MTSLVTAQYDGNKNQILDPNSRGTPATLAIDPLTGKATGLVDPTGGAFMRPLVAKIKAGIAAAEKLNPVEAQPWLPPASINTGPGNLARANSTAYPAGITVTNAAGTHQFTCITGGTSAASEPAGVTTAIVATAPYNMTAIQDGSAYWMWMGPVRTPTALAGAPSLYSGAKLAALTQEITFGAQVAYQAAYTTKMQFAGGVGAVSGGTANWLVVTKGGLCPAGQGNVQVSAAQNVNFSNFASSVTFMTDATLIAFDMTTGAAAAGLPVSYQLAIEVDGRRVMDGAAQAVTALVAPNGFINLDFRSSGGRKVRKIRIYSQSVVAPGSYGRFYVAPQDVVFFPTNANRWRLACVGDSIFNGSASGPLIPGWDRASIFAALIGCDDVCNLGAGGTGFIANNGATQFTYIQRLPDLVATQPDVVYIGGAFNDTAGAALQAAALLYYQSVRAVLPNAVIIQAGTYGGVSPSTVQAIDASLLAAMTAFQATDKNAYFIPVSTDPISPWGSGTGNLNAPNSSGNSDIYIGPTDAVHPQPLGTLYLAGRDATAFKALINSIS